MAVVSVGMKLCQASVGGVAAVEWFWGCARPRISARCSSPL
jgi:hypothetical protein